MLTGRIARSVSVRPLSNKHRSLFAITTRHRSNNNNIIVRPKISWLDLRGAGLSAIERLSIEELAHDVALKYLPQAQERNITLAAPEPSGLPSVYADISMVERTLDNLIDNALRYTPPGGRIEIGLHAASAGVQISVVDNGHGIPPADLPHIFDRFYRGPKGPSLQDNGTGLGLAISRKVVEAHGGTLEVKSRVNQGTTFTFSLPTQAPAEA